MQVIETTAIQVEFEQILAASDIMRISNEQGDGFISDQKDYSSEIWGD